MLENENFRAKIENWLKDADEKKAFDEKVKELGENFDSVAKLISLRTLDTLWVEHLEAMEHLRDSVRLRAYGQQDPLVEYKNEGHKMFQNLLKMIESSIVQTLFRASLTKEPTASVPQSQYQKIGLPTEALRSGAPASAIAMAGKKVGRNDPCPCGAKHPDGRPIKYKHCHGK